MQMLTEGYSLMSTCDGTFKQALDRYKYPNRYPEIDPIENRDAASSFIHELEQRLDGNLFGPDPKLADFAILPFIRQFAHVDLDWFSAQPWEKLRYGCRILRFGSVRGDYGQISKMGERGRANIFSTSELEHSYASKSKL